MFKAKLIENQHYYRLRSKQLLLVLLPSIPIGILVNFYQIPTWVTLLMIGVYILAIVLLLRNQKQMSSVLGSKWIEFDVDEIRIKSKEEMPDTTIPLNQVEKIILKNEYSIPQETIQEVGQELAGKTKQNYVIIHQNSKQRKLDFEVDSHYMIHQLNKLIETWEMKGYKIERMNEN